MFCPKCQKEIKNYPKTGSFKCPWCKAILNLRTETVTKASEQWISKGRLTSPYLYSPFIEIMLSLKTNPRTLIDIGCGTGIYGVLFRMHSRTPENLLVIGYDLENRIDFDDIYDIFHKGEFWKINRERRIDLNYAPQGYKNPLILCLNILDIIEKENGKHLLHELGKLGHPLMISVTTLADKAMYTDIKGKIKIEGAAKWTFPDLVDTLRSFYKFAWSWIIQDPLYQNEHLFVVFDNQEFREHDKKFLETSSAKSFLDLQKEMEAEDQEWYKNYLKEKEAGVYDIREKDG